jgi:hypothetical protein
VLNQQRRTAYDEFAAAVRERPNEWAVLPGQKATVDSAKGTAMNIRQGRMKAFMPKGKWDAVVDGTTIYVRYTGEATASTGGEDVQQEQVTVEGGKKVEASVIRAWARENGFSDLPERGRLPGNVIAAFEEAQDSAAPDEEEGRPEGD